MSTVYFHEFFYFVSRTKVTTKCLLAARRNCEMSNCRSGRHSELFQASIANVVALIGDAVRDVCVPYTKKLAFQWKCPARPHGIASGHIVFSFSHQTHCCTHSVQWTHIVLPHLSDVQPKLLCLVQTQCVHMFLLPSVSIHKQPY